jgi:hypothetical protein
MSSNGRIGFFAIVLAISGCGEASYEEARTSKAVFPASAAGAAPPTSEMPTAPGMMAGMMGGMMGAKGAGATPADSAPAKAIPRKIIYNADVQITVEDFQSVSDRITRLIKEYGGYLADSNVSGKPGELRSGRWKVRIPVGRFDSFVDAVVALGELQSRQTNSQDVTEEYYDLEARIKNKKIEETRLLKHLEESTGKLEEILNVEREVARVRGEIEQGEGRLRLLANLTELTTVTINVSERREFKPLTAPDFKTRIAQTFQKSADRFTDFCKDVVLAVVAMVPWLPVWIVALLVIWVVLRIAIRMIRAQLAAAPAGRRPESFGGQVWIDNPGGPGHDPAPPAPSAP